MGKKTKTNLLLLIVVIVILFFVSEIIFRVHYHKTNKIIGATDEERCTKELYQKVSNISNPNRFSIGRLHGKLPWGKGLEYSPHLGMIPKQNCGYVNFILKGISDGKPVNVVGFGETSTNAQRMRGFKNFDYQKSSDSLRIAVLGDSFAWGANTALKYNFASLLEELIPNSEVLNFGIVSIGTDIMYLRWKYEALKYKPDVLIMQIYTDDISRASPCIKKPKLENKDGNLIVINSPPPTLEDLAKNYKHPKFESYFLKHFLYTLRHIKGAETAYDYGFKILDPILEEMKEKSKDDCTFFMVAIINSHGKPSPLEIKEFTRLKGVLEEKQIPYVESFAIFEQEGYGYGNPSLYSKDTGSPHFNALGHALFAQGIKNKLEELKIINKQKDYYFTYDYEPDLDILKEKLSNIQIEDSQKLSALFKGVTKLNLLLELQNKEDKADTKFLFPFEIIYKEDVKFEDC